MAHKQASRPGPGRLVFHESFEKALLVRFLVVLAAVARPSLLWAGPTPRIPEGMARLKAAYPKAICRTLPNRLVFCDGRSMRYDDGRTKTPEEKLVSPDLEDQMSVPYPAGPQFPIPPRTDPGRIRYQPFFEKIYGSTRRQVGRNLVRVLWKPASPRRVFVRFHRGRAARMLQLVANELAALPRRLRRMVRKRPSTFVWRRIKGTKRLSAHSFGIAIDLTLRHRSYWRWDLFGPAHRMRYRKDLPAAIVCIFERHGFIWGGKWRHYDTMHFEFRPELLLKKDESGTWSLPAPCPRSAGPNYRPVPSRLRRRIPK